jgi:hypothetical protein
MPASSRDAVRAKKSRTSRPWPSLAETCWACRHQVARRGLRAGAVGPVLGDRLVLAGTGEGWPVGSRSSPRRRRPAGELGGAVAVAEDQHPGQGGVVAYRCLFRAQMGATARFGRDPTIQGSNHPWPLRCRGEGDDQLVEVGVLAEPRSGGVGWPAWRRSWRAAGGPTGRTTSSVCGSSSHRAPLRPGGRLGGAGRGAGPGDPGRVVVDLGLVHAVELDGERWTSAWPGWPRRSRSR